MAIDCTVRVLAARDLICTMVRKQSEQPDKGGNTVMYVAAYSQEEMIEDVRRRTRGERLACPSCGWTDAPDRSRRLFDIYMEKAPSGGLGYSYRLCKVCGFAQDTDGGESYRVWLSAHKCRPRGVPVGKAPLECRHCWKTVGVVDGEVEPHMCGKYLRQGDSGYCCNTCGEWQGPASAFPLPGDRRKTVRHEQSSAA